MHFALFLHDFGKCLVKDSKRLLTLGFRHLVTLAVKGEKNHIRYFGHDD